MQVAERIRSFLFSHGAECVLIKEAQEITEDIECVLVLGGDGTMLQAANEIAGKNILMT